MKPRLLFFGPPGSGKSTQGELLAEKLEAPHISVGELLRAEAASDTARSKAIADRVNQGLMVQDEVVMELLQERLAHPVVLENGFILDGFPRTGEQVPLWDALVKEFGLDDYLAIDIALSPEESFERLISRGRPDDTSEVIRRRLDKYQAMAAPVLKAFESRSKLLVIDGLGPISEIAARVEKALEKHLP